MHALIRIVALAAVLAFCAVPVDAVPATGNGAPQSYSSFSAVAFTSLALTNGAYVTAASPSLTLGTSTGSIGAWRVTVTFVGTNGQVNNGLSTCIAGTNAGSGGVGTSWAPATVCQATISNALAGGPLLYGVGNATSQFVGSWSAQYANGATVAFTCQIQASSTAQTATGYCLERADPI